jgi:hypothetical protein
MEKQKFKGKPNLNGRPKGAVNKTAAATKDILADIVKGELEYLELHLDSLKVKDRIEVLIKLLPYVTPKMNHIELDAEVTSYTFTPVTIIANETLKVLPDGDN